ncbi:MAG: hypothetical protein AB7N76_28480 [Planctomycetota bacterium]
MQPPPGMPPGMPPGPPPGMPPGPPPGMPPGPPPGGGYGPPPGGPPPGPPPGQTVPGHNPVAAAAQQRAAQAAAAMASVGVSPDKLQGMLADQVKAKPVSMIGKVLFVVGFALFSLTTFVGGWNRAAYKAANGEIGAIKARNWDEPIEPGMPKEAPDPTKGEYRYMYGAMADVQGSDPPKKQFKIDITADMQKAIDEDNKKRKEAFEKARDDWHTGPYKEYAEAKWKYDLEFWKDNPHEKITRINELTQAAAKARHKSGISVMGYFVRWLGLGLMFLGMALLAVLGDKQEQLVALLVLGIGLIWPMVNMGFIPLLD